MEGPSAQLRGVGEDVHRAGTLHHEFLEARLLAGMRVDPAHADLSDSRYPTGRGRHGRGGSKTSHLRANIESLSRGPLSDDLVAACDEVGTALRGPMPAYNR